MPRRSGPTSSLALFLALAGLLAGCISPAGVTTGEFGTAGNAGARPVVVAVIDTGINPYHEAFAATPLADAASMATLAGARSIPLSSGGSYEEALEADQEALASVELRELVHFPGTRVLAMSLHEDEDGPVVLDSRGHGTQTASLVLRDAPHAIVVSIKIDPSYCIPPTDCFIPRVVSEAMAWAAAREWIDVISVSLQMVANVPDPSAVHPEVGDYLRASRLAAERGKLVITAAGNYGSPTLGSYLCGPSWVICVGGTFGGGSSDVAFAGRGVDVSANYTEKVASHEGLDDYVWSRGTSFATPIVAAVCAETLWHLQGAGSSLDRSGGLGGVAARVQQVRHALNSTATTPSATDWRPSVEPEPPGPGTFLNATVLNVPVLLPGQIGWGYVHAGLIPQVIANLDAPPETDTPRAMAQAKYQQAREEYWARA